MVMHSVTNEPGKILISVKYSSDPGHQP